MEKYSVSIDPKKVKQEKEKGEKTASSTNDPNINVPKDPVKGTEPYEKTEED